MALQADLARLRAENARLLRLLKLTPQQELRPGSRGRSEIRILFVFDPWRSAILLVAGDKAGNWTKWYARMIPRAEQFYEIYLKERAAEEGSQ
jgi:hypothetical protein